MNKISIIYKNIYKLEVRGKVKTGVSANTPKLQENTKKSLTNAVYTLTLVVNTTILKIKDKNKVLIFNY